MTDAEGSSQNVSLHVPLRCVLSLCEYHDSSCCRWCLSMLRSDMEKVEHWLDLQPCQEASQSTSLPFLRHCPSDAMSVPCLCMAACVYPFACPLQCIVAWMQTYYAAASAMFLFAQEVLLLDGQDEEGELFDFGDAGLAGVTAIPEELLSAVAELTGDDPNTLRHDCAASCMQLWPCLAGSWPILQHAVLELLSM